MEGNWAKFGLVRVDPESREREIKTSGRFYSEVIRNKGVTREMYQTYVAKQEYEVR